MGTAAASQPAEEVGALDELRFHWGEAYNIALVDGMWTAWRKDDRGRQARRSPRGSALAADPG